MITARPILFSTPMVRALLDGRKSMTRRTVKQQERLRMGTDVLIEGDHRPEYPNEYGRWQQWVPNAKTMRCPYGVPGDLLYVKENHYITDDGHNEYAVFSADESKVREHAATLKRIKGTIPENIWQKHAKLRPSIHMPRKFSRLTLELTDVRVERLQDMEGQHPSESDAIAEGVNEIHHGDGAYYYSAFRNEPHPKNWCDPTDAFRELWEKINGNGSWDLNPWVWVLSFKVHHANAQEFVDRAIYEARAAIAKAEDAP